MRQVITNGKMGSDNSILTNYNVRTWQGRYALTNRVNYARNKWPGQYVRVEYYNGNLVFGEPNRTDLFANDMVAV